MSEVVALNYLALQKKLEVMVVDDSITMRKYAERALRRLGVEPVLARDGMEALHLIRKSPPVLILLDLEMPKMDGFELARMLRDEPKYRDIPIIVISSRSGEKHRAKMHEIGVQGFLGKPYQESELLDMITELNLL